MADRTLAADGLLAAALVCTARLRSGGRSRLSRVPELAAESAGPRPWNVVLITVDALRADRTSLYGNARPKCVELVFAAKTRKGWTARRPTRRAADLEPRVRPLLRRPARSEAWYALRTRVADSAAQALHCDARGPPLESAECRAAR